MKTNRTTIKKYIKKTKPKLAIISKFIRDFELKNVIYIEDVVELSRLCPKTYDSSLVQPNDLFEIVFTSGTTAEPKGVMISHENVLANCDSIVPILPKLRYYETLSILPLSHVFEQMINLMLMTKVGGKIIFLPKINSLTISRALYYNKCTHLVIVPQVMRNFMTSIERKASEAGKLATLQKMLKISEKLPVFLRRKIFSKVHSQFGNSLGFFILGGATLDKESAKKLESIGIKIVEGYGATEVTAVATAPKSINKRVLGSIGKPVKNVQVKIVNGEIHIKGPNVTKGYYKDKIKTDESFVNGWYKTGDVGKFDKKRNLYFTGRDAFKIVLSTGENIYAEDIEKEINLHPLVKESCICAHQIANKETIHAYLILKRKSNLDKIVREVNKKLESKQQIRSYALWNEEDFPRTRTLKIDRKVIHNKLQKIKIAKPSSIKTSDPLIMILKEVSSKNKITENMSLSLDLNIDSLDRAEILARIEEEFGVEIGDFDIKIKTTVKELRNKIKIGSKKASSKFDLSIFNKSNQIIKNLLQLTFFFPFHRLYIKIKILDKHNIKKIKAPSIIIFNHVGLLDGACCLRILPINLRSKVATGTADYFWGKDGNGKFGKLLHHVASAFPLYGANLDDIGYIFDKGWFFMTSPEGRLQREGELQNFRKGVVYYAKTMNVSIIPIKISENYYELYPPPSGKVTQASVRDLLPKKKGIVTVRIGKPIYIKESMSIDQGTKHIYDLMKKM